MYLLGTPIWYLDTYITVILIASPKKLYNNHGESFKMTKAKEDNTFTGNTPSRTITCGLIHKSNYTG